MRRRRSLRRRGWRCATRTWSRIQGPASPPCCPSSDSSGTERSSAGSHGAASGAIGRRHFDPSCGPPTARNWTSSLETTSSGMDTRDRRSRSYTIDLVGRRRGAGVKRFVDLHAFVEKIHRHWEWGRSEGFLRLVEEDELNPLLRASNLTQRWWWRRTHHVARGTAMPVFLVGAQRSGTNMIVHGLQRCPEFEVYNENHPRAFASFRLRSNETITSIVASSRHRYVLFKPLIDSHAIDRLLDDLVVRTPGRALWAYRNVDDRVRSSISKFGDANLQALAEIASGAGTDRWEAGGLTNEALAIVRSFDYGRLDAASASALFWYLRNSFFFDLGLDRRSDVLPVSYDAVVHDPEAEMRVICRFLAFPWRPTLVAHMRKPLGPPKPPLPLEPSIRELCDELIERLDTARLGRRAPQR